MLILLGACSGPPSHLAGQDPGPRRDAGPADAAADLFPCDPLAQTCPTGDGCFWVGPGAFHCLPADGLPRYHVCQNSTECSPGDGCHLDDFYEFYCVAYCDYRRYAGQRDPDHCGEHELCATFDGEVGVCLGICDPLDSSCPSGQVCTYIEQAADLCFPQRADGAAGDGCARSNDCQPGLGCVGTGDDAHCATYCDHDSHPETADPRCDSGQVCHQLYPGERIGYCDAP